MIRVLIIDDSAFSRRSLRSMLESSGEIQVVGVAVDGKEGLRLAAELKPDVITLDLEMPKLDGFNFLRILMHRSPVPVIVVSSYAGRGDVLRALDLGALDFLAKPSQAPSASLMDIRDALLSKVVEASSARMDLYLRDRRPEEITGFHSLAALTEAMPPSQGKRQSSPGLLAPAQPTETPLGLVVIGASTGGPRALRKILRPLSDVVGWPVAVVQHMPARFTKDFALRLSRKLSMDIDEATDGEPLRSRRVLISPGGLHMVVERSSTHGPFVRLRVPSPTDRYIPSVDRLFESAASVYGANVIGVVLTGMGNDGVAGAIQIRAGGGKVVAEDSSTAVVFGMPRNTIEAQAADAIVPLDRVPITVEQLVTLINQQATPRG